MRRSCTQLLRATSSLWASQHPPDGVSMEDMRKEAKVKGFGRRDSAEDKMFMNETFATTECVGDNVRVANLPAKQQEETQFDVYQRSTSEFSSLVTPHGVREAGIGGGFGAKKDTRLGFLRPRQTSLQPITGSAALAPKYDENGFPLENNLTREDWKEKRKKFMKSFDGMTMSHNEHFLLADLDFEKDTVLFGNTREEFERNVIKLKKVIVAYTRWERTDNIYHYSTVMLKILTVWVLMESIHQYFELKLLAENFDVFAEVLDEEMKALDDTRRADFDQAMAELQHSKPDFAPIVEAIRKERERVHAVALRENSTHHDKNSVLSLLDSTEHPMDTTGEAAYLRQSEDRVQEGEMAKLQASAVKDARRGWWSAVWGFVVGGRHGAGQNAPLQQDDFTKFSYAASPTSIDSVRFLRRILLPRSEDFTQIVREEMVAYQREKDQRVATPST